MLFNIILATIIVSLVSLIGILVIFKKENKAGFLKAMISLAAGALLGVAFLDLLPEAIEANIYKPYTIFATVLASIIVFFLLERVFHWHHCRCGEHGRPCADDKKSLIFVNLTGDAIHNFVDGALIASAFLLDFNAGILVTLAVILHEIPQEISDFGVLLYAGLSRTKAILYNVMTALIAVLGAVVFYYYGSQFANALPLIIAFAAGNFIYLSTADLMPELHHEERPRKIFYHTLWLLIGVLLVYLAGQIIPHS